MCENLLGLCYEIRHAWQGDRNIEQVFNGIHEDWFDDYQEPDSHKRLMKIVKLSNDEFRLSFPGKTSLMLPKAIHTSVFP